jgi:hypothetical protein
MAFPIQLIEDPRKLAALVRIATAFESIADSLKNIGGADAIDPVAVAAATASLRASDDDLASTVNDNTPKG